jgi:GNT-I family
MNLSGTAIVATAKSRPDYLNRTLKSWRQVRGISDVHSYTLALGHDKEMLAAQARNFGAFMDAAGLRGRARIKLDSPAAAASRGMHRAIGEAANHVFADPAVEFAVFGEEDVAVSADVLEYMSWARELFAGNERVLCVCAHSVGGAGYDEPGACLRDGDADQEAVRLLPYFNGWCWGVWRDRWEKVMEPSWDWECNSGSRGYDSGYDWSLQVRVIPQGNYVCAVPDASRSQHIGQFGGWAASSDPAAFAATQAASFRQEREPVKYRLLATGNSSETSPVPADIMS